MIHYYILIISKACKKVFRTEVSHHLLIVEEAIRQTMNRSVRKGFKGDIKISGSLSINYHF